MSDETVTVGEWVPRLLPEADPVPCYCGAPATHLRALVLAGARVPVWQYGCGACIDRPRPE